MSADTPATLSWAGPGDSWRGPGASPDTRARWFVRASALYDPVTGDERPYRAACRERDAQ